MAKLGTEKKPAIVRVQNEHRAEIFTQIADALIGATAVTYGLPILTGNNKHYKVIKDIQLKRFHP